MTKKEYCTKNAPIAYYCGIPCGVLINGIEYGINSYIYCTCNSCSDKKTHHKLKVKYDATGNAYIILYGYKIALNECLKMEG